MGKHDLLRCERVWEDWKPVWWFPLMERREVYADLITPVWFNQYRWSERIKRFGRTVLDMLCPVQPLKVGISLGVVPDIEQFNWLRDYGPLWEPDCTAFWLDPDTDAERQAWMAKYKYGLDHSPIPNPYTNDFDRATLGEYQHFKELTDAQMVKQMAIMQGTTPALMAAQSQAYGGMNYQTQQLSYLQQLSNPWNSLLGLRK